MPKVMCVQRLAKRMAEVLSTPWRLAPPALLSLAVGTAATSAAFGQAGIPQPTCKADTARMSFTAPDPRPVEQIIEDDPSLAKRLAARKTVNVAGPWLDRNVHKVQDYGVVWHNWTSHPGGNVIWLREVYWAYRSTANRQESFRFHGPELENFITKDVWPTLAEYGPTFRLAFENQSFPAYLADTVERTLAETGADGALLDLWLDEQPSFPAAKVRKARIALAQEIRRRIGPGPILMGNVGWTRDRSTHSYLNAVFMELWKQPSERGYSCNELLTMEDLLAFHDRHLAQPKLVVFEPWRETQEDSKSDRTTESNLRWAGLFAAMAAVVPRNGYVIYSDNAVDREIDDHGHTYYGIFRTDLGRPASGATPVARGVGYRLFEKGVAAYNATPHEVEIRMPGSAAPLVIPALSGAFCSGSGDGWDCAH